MRRLTGWTIAALATATMIAACGGSSSGMSGTANNPARTIAKDPGQSGDAQTAAVATEPADSLRVVVMEDGVPLAGATVTWSTTGAGARVSPATSQTDAEGIAATKWTLSQRAGTQTATASLAGASGSPVAFHATATPGPASILTKVAGDEQTGIIRGSFPTQLKVAVTDQFANPLSGVRVNFAQTGGVTPVNTAVLTDASGQAATTVIGADAPGPASVTVLAGGIANPPIFTLTTADAVREVRVGPDISFASLFNESVNPAVDTIAAGQGVLWRWAGGSHSVQSTGTTIFRNSTVSSTVGNLYILTFNTAGTYQYQCEVHGAEMTGRVVVQ
jgi:plastocyanin